MLAETKVGPRVVADGAQIETRSERSGCVVTADGHGRYQEAVLRGNVFFAANQAGIATPVGLATASKNFTLYNPFGSGKNLVLLDITIQSQSNAASGGLYLVGNLNPTQVAPATNTTETVRNALLGGPSGAGLVYNTTTLPATPVIIRLLPGLVFTTSGMLLAYARDEVAGSIIIPPGIFISVQGSAAFTILCSMTWEEVLQ